MGTTLLRVGVALSLTVWLGTRPVDGQSTVLRPATEVADALQARYDGVRDFSAAFEHRYEGGLLRKATSERGTVGAARAAGRERHSRAVRPAPDSAPRGQRDTPGRDVR